MRTLKLLKRKLHRSCYDRDKLPGSHLKSWGWLHGSSSSNALDLEHLMSKHEENPNEIHSNLINAVDENIALKKNLKLKVKLPQPKSQVENITVKKKLKLKVKLPRAKWSEEEKSDLVYKDQDLMEISKRKLPPKLHGHLRRLGLLCENKDDGEIASEIHIFTSSCFKSNVMGKFANTTGGTCGQDSSLKDLKNNNTNPKCESATSKRLGNPAAAYPKGSFGDMKSRCSYDNAFSEASSGVECLKTCEGQLSPSKSLRAAMLKSRFADTILKAQQKTLSIGERVDQLKVKQEERERFEKKQREEKARIDAHVKAAKEEATLKLLRQRQAARLALEEARTLSRIHDASAMKCELQPNGKKKKKKKKALLKSRFGVECLKTCEGQLSPSKSLRAAMLKSRFADTILKAQQKTLSIGERVDPLKVKQGERERFEKKQREERARIDAHVKVAKEEAALKLLRQRQAARLALEEIFIDLLNMDVQLSVWITQSEVGYDTHVSTYPFSCCSSSRKDPSD
ncbi:hypothetical protein Syun_028432 [Stephania yunnanensis]|uniref:Uncharacterized protein n=1 Tax=Stephania yunnanensis TaxID=152371 RepID=A0AAP0EHC9_9MAGN